MWTKIKAILIGAGGLVVSALCLLLHIRNEQVKSLKAEKKALKKEKDMQSIATQCEREMRDSQSHWQNASQEEVRKRIEEIWRRK